MIVWLTYVICCGGCGLIGTQFSMSRGALDSRFWLIMLKDTVMISEELIISLFLWVIKKALGGLNLL